MKQEQWEGKIIPAQLSFLAIYSPPLGTTDETFREQVVFYYSRASKGTKSQIRKKGARSTARDTQNEAFADREEENEKLRQIGLAQGMVDFARSFSNNQAVNSVETEKSRIILHELERGWWLLASIDLTRLPTLGHSNASKSHAGDNKPKVEYSAREVSPAPLLLQQVLTANRIFLLHHGPSLSDLYLKVSRDKFCNVLDRFWSRFCRNWEVLLHGNPAVEVFGGLKLAAGGELGMGVGEEEWGSGERDVLEDLVRQTEGLVDLTVSRFGQAAPPEPDNAADDPSNKTLDEAQSGLPWLGGGHLPDASDGVIFGGTGAIARTSLRDVSSWVQEVYTFGEYAYGVKDNPHRQRRKRRRRPPPAAEEDEPADLRRKAHEQSQNRPEDGAEKKPENELGFPLPHDPRPQMHDRVASHDHATGTASPQVATHPGIPPPIVTAAEESLNAASRAAALPRQPRQEPPKTEQTGSRYGISDKWTKYLTLGLVNPSSGRSRSSSPAQRERPEPPRRTSSSSSKTIRPSNSKGSIRRVKEPDIPEGDDEDGPMRTLDPAPDGHELTAQLARQRTAESRGHFLIGFKGDLDKPPTDEDDATATDTQLSSEETEGERTMLRTLQVELVPTTPTGEDEQGDDTNSFSDASSTDQSHGPQTKRLRILVYVHRPFIYTFLFEQRSPNLTITTFYSTLHNHLRPLHRPLLKSTSLQQVAYRIADAHTSPEDASINTNSPPYAPPKNNPVFDLVHDPLTLTTHTSIPNIPDPGTPAAEGFATTSTGRNDPPLWTRIEAINVHSQILNTLAATKPNHHETERTSKTSRGWWVVWLRIPSTPSEDSAASRGRDDYETCRQAFLVRKATDGSISGRQRGGASASGSRVGSGMFGGLGEAMGLTAASVEKDDKEESQAVGWGLGIDARKYVEGLLSLNR